MLCNFYKVGEMRYSLDTDIADSFTEFKSLFNIWSKFNNLEFEFQSMVDSIVEGVEKNVEKKTNKD